MLSTDISKDANRASPVAMAVYFAVLSAGFSAAAAAPLTDDLAALDAPAGAPTT
jgi:hypothetical protein